MDQIIYTGLRSITGCLLTTNLLLSALCVIQLWRAAMERADRDDRKRLRDSYNDPLDPVYSQGDSPDDGRGPQA